jgi:hypothetical protein
MMGVPAWHPGEHGRCGRRIRCAHRAVLEYPLMLYMAKALGRPIKWVSTRSEDFLTDNHGRAIRLEGELAFDSRGRFIAMRTDWLCDCGAYLTQAGSFTNCFNGLTIGAGAYQVERSMAATAVMTNTSLQCLSRRGTTEALYRRAARRCRCRRDRARSARNSAQNVIAATRCRIGSTGSVFDSGVPGLIAKPRSIGWSKFGRRLKRARGVVPCAGSVAPCSGCPVAD